MEIVLIVLATLKAFFWRSVEYVQLYQEKYGGYWSYQ